MDPFQPEDKNQTADLQHLLDGLHQNFKEAVTNARGKRLDLNAKDLFEGQVWCVAVTLLGQACRLAVHAGQPSVAVL